MFSPQAAAGALEATLRAAVAPWIRQGRQHELAAALRTCHEQILAAGRGSGLRQAAEAPCLPALPNASARFFHANPADCVLPCSWQEVAELYGIPLDTPLPAQEAAAASPIATSALPSPPEAGAGRASPAPGVSEPFAFAADTQVCWPLLPDTARYFVPDSLEEALPPPSEEEPGGQAGAQQQEEAQQPNEGQDAEAGVGPASALLATLEAGRQEEQEEAPGQQENKGVPSAGPPQQQQQGAQQQQQQDIWAATEVSLPLSLPRLPLHVGTIGSTSPVSRVPGPDRCPAAPF